MNEKPRNFPIVAGTMACLLLIGHITLAIIVVVSPRASEGSNVLTFYRRYIVLGPFFQSERITASPHLIVSERTDGVWTKAEVPVRVRELEGISRYRAVQWGKFGVYLARRTAYSRSEYARAERKRELEAFVKEGAVGANVDSLAVSCVVRRNVDLSIAFSDTLYTFKFPR